MTPESTRDAPDASPARKAGGENGYTVRALDRALTILKCFDAERPAWSLVELSRHTGLHKATTFRLVKTLESQGFLHYGEGSNQYRLGPSLLRMGFIAHSHEELVRMAHPHLEWLAAETEETADLAVWAGNGVLFLDQVLTSRPFKPLARVGRLFTDFQNSHAKVVAAFGPVEWRRRLEEEDAAAPGGAGPGPDELQRVRRDGYGLDLGNRTAGICAVSAPVLDAAGDLVASISIVAPDHRFGPQHRERFARAVKQAAARLSDDLGYADVGSGRPR